MDGEVSDAVAVALDEEETLLSRADRAMARSAGSAYGRRDALAFVADGRSPVSAEVPHDRPRRRGFLG